MITYGAKFKDHTQNSKINKCTAKNLPLCTRKTSKRDVGSPPLPTQTLDVLKRICAGMCWMCVCVCMVCVYVLYVYDVVHMNLVARHVLYKVVQAFVCVSVCLLVCL